MDQEVLKKYNKYVHDIFYPSEYKNEPYQVPGYLLEKVDKFYEENEELKEKINKIEENLQELQITSRKTIQAINNLMRVIKDLRNEE